MLSLTIVSALVWVVILLLPWRPWGTSERLSAKEDLATQDLSDITVLIPARNEAVCIQDTLRAVAAQGSLARIVLVDDESEDGTGDLARGLGLENLQVLRGQRPAPGWSGKLWALSQGLDAVTTPYTLLLDADITLSPGILSALKDKLEREELDLVSIMASLSMANWWERLLIPPFIYFFKMIYPFALANSRHPLIAAAAGGCILIRTGRLRGIGGFAALKDALIDDCTLARRVKDAGGKTWLGLSRDVAAARPYDSVGTIWNMVARTAYTQLRYSALLLALCTLGLFLIYLVPVLGLAAADPWAKAAALTGLVCMSASYLPLLRYYGRHWLWSLTMPLSASLYLAMTWTSALRFYRGERSRWKNRSYQR